MHRDQKFEKERENPIMSHVCTVKKSSLTNSFFILCFAFARPRKQLSIFLCRLTDHDTILLFSTTYIAHLFSYEQTNKQSVHVHQRTINHI